MSKTTRLQQIKELLASGQTEEAADLLLKLSKETDEAHYHSALMLKNQLEHHQHDLIDGILSDNEQRIGWAKISRRIIELTKQIERGEKPKSVEEVIGGKHSTGKPFSFNRWLLVVPILLILGFIAVNLMPEKKETVEMITFEGQISDPHNKPLVSISCTIKPDMPVPGLSDNTVQFDSDAKGRISFKYPPGLLNQQVTVLYSKSGKVIDKRREKFMPQKFKHVTLQKQE